MNPIALSFKTPMRYYAWLRKQARYTPGAAFMATLAVFCTSEKEMKRRLRKRFSGK